MNVRAALFDFTLAVVMTVIVITTMVLTGVV